MTRCCCWVCTCTGWATGTRWPRTTASSPSWETSWRARAEEEGEEGARRGPQARRGQQAAARAARAARRRAARVCLKVSVFGLGEVAAQCSSVCIHATSRDSRILTRHHTPPTPPLAASHLETRALGLLRKLHATHKAATAVAPVKRGSGRNSNNANNSHKAKQQLDKEHRLAAAAAADAAAGPSGAAREREQSVATRDVGHTNGGPAAGKRKAGAAAAAYADDGQGQSEKRARMDSKSGGARPLRP